MSSTTYACVECGHLHYLAVEKRYTVCPIEECDCGGQDATGKPIHLDLERSKRFGEPVPAAIDRLRMRSRASSTSTLTDGSTSRSRSTSTRRRDDRAGTRGGPTSTSTARPSAGSSTAGPPRSSAGLGHNPYQGGMPHD